MTMRDRAFSEVTNFPDLICQPAHIHHRKATGAEHLRHGKGPEHLARAILINDVKSTAVSGHFSEDPENHDMIRHYWASWVNSVRYRKHLWRCRITIRTKLVHRLALAALTSWKELVHRHQQKWLRSRRVIHWAARRLEQNALRAWSHFAPVASARRRHLKSALLFCLRRILRNTTQSWGNLTKLESRRAGEIQSSVDAFVKSARLNSLRDWLAIWNDEYSQRTSLRLHCSSAANLKSRTLQLQTVQALARCLHAWWNLLVHRRTQEKRARVALNSLLEKRCLSKWNQHARAESREKEERYISRARHVCIINISSSIFSKWKKRVAYRARRSELLTAAILMVVRCSKRGSLHLWAKNCKVSAHQRVLLEQAEDHRRDVVVARFLCEWRLRAQSSTLHSRRKEMAEILSERRIFLCTIKAFRMVISAQKSKVVLGRKAAMFHYLSRLRRVLFTWGGTADTSYVSRCRFKKSLHEAVCMIRMKKMLRHALSRFKLVLVMLMERQADLAVLHVAISVRLSKQGFWGWMMGLQIQSDAQNQRLLAQEHFKCLLEKTTICALRTYVSKAKLRRLEDWLRIHHMQSRLRNQVKSVSLDCWRAASCRLVLKRLALMRARTFHTLNHMQQGFQSWVQNLARAKVLQSIHSSIADRRRAEVKRNALVHWQVLNQVARCLQYCFLRCLEVTRRRALRHSCAVWAAFRQKRTEKRLREQAAMLERRAYLLRVGAAKWLEGGISKIAKRQSTAAQCEARRHSRIFARVAR